MHLDISDLDFDELLLPLEELRNCRICLRNCNADRINNQLGFCKSNAKFSISSIGIHQGEEPAISGTDGICNVFFTNCNLQCSFCQNYQISDNRLSHRIHEKPLSRVLNEIIEVLDKGIPILGFVSPSHFIPHVKIIVNALRQLGYNPTIVYNSNGYDKLEQLRQLNGVVDVYLPDFKYLDNELSEKWSMAQDYKERATEALTEMYCQMGSQFTIGDDQYAKKGLLIRHLVMPTAIENSIEVLRWLAKNFSLETHLSLLSQYHPTINVCNDYSLGRNLKNNEYEKVLEEVKRLGFVNAHIQTLERH